MIGPPAPRIYHLDNNYWGVVIVLPGCGQHMRNDFENADEALDWILDLQAMHAQVPDYAVTT
jgi:hypothetical protein